MINIISREQPAAYPNSALNWYPQQALNLFAPLKATTRVEFAVELVSRIAIVATVVFLGAMSIYVIRQYFVQRISPPNQITTNDPQSITDPSFKYPRLFPYDFDSEDPLWADFTDEDWQNFRKDEVNLPEMKHPLYFELGVQCYINVKKLILESPEGAQFWDFLYAKADDDWKNDYITTFRESNFLKTNIKENSKTKKPLYFYVHIVAQILQLSGRLHFASIFFSRNNNKPNVYAVRFTTLMTQFEYHKESTYDIVNILKPECKRKLGKRINDAIKKFQNISHENFDPNEIEQIPPKWRPKHRM